MTRRVDSYGHMERHVRYQTAQIRRGQRRRRRTVAGLRLRFEYESLYGRFIRLCSANGIDLGIYGMWKVRQALDESRKCELKKMKWTRILLS